MKQRCHAEQNFNYRPTPPSAGVRAPTWSEKTVGGIKQRGRMKEEEADGAISTWCYQSMLKGARIRASSVYRAGKKTHELTAREFKLLGFEAKLKTDIDLNKLG